MPHLRELATVTSATAVLLAAALVPQSLWADDGRGNATQGGSVADSATAVRLAEAALVAAHGEFPVDVQSYLAYLRDDLWIVKGTFGNLHLEYAFTHPYVVEISMNDGRILRVETE